MWFKKMGDLIVEMEISWKVNVWGSRVDMGVEMLDWGRQISGGWNSE